MAEIKPLHALHYNPEVAGPFEAVAAPPYDVIDEPQREALAAKSQFNVVEIDLPRTNSGDPYAHAKSTLDDWRKRGVVIEDPEPAIWALTQDYTTPEGQALTRHGFFCRVRITDYGPGQIRPHERIHPGPKEDRLRLTRATRANLSPIFSLFSDPEARAWQALEPATRTEPFAAVTDADNTVHRLWRVADPGAIDVVANTLSDRELLIADGHHRYETARIYADEIGGEGAHRYVLMFLCWLTDSGLTVFATHRLLSGLDNAQLDALDDAVSRHFDVEDVGFDSLEPPPDAPGLCFGYLDSRELRPRLLTLKDASIADRALSDKPAPYRRLETAVLEQLVLRESLRMSETQISEQAGLDYAKTVADAREAITSGRCQAAFFLRATPVEQVREIAQAGESMPPKSTFFFPKIPTGLVFSPLE